MLKCSEKHYFHTECISGWIKSGKNTCPLCKGEIEDAQNLQKHAEGGSAEPAGETP